MRTTIAWAVMAAGMVAFGMFLGSLSRGSATAPIMMLGILGAGVTIAGGRSIAKGRRRAAKNAAADTKRRRDARRFRSILLIVLLFVAALAGAFLVRKYF